MNQIQLQAATQAMTEWLAHPQGLGKPPAQLECAGEFDLNGLHYYIFRYKRTILDSQWLLGVCGGFIGSSTEHCDHVYSRMEPCRADSLRKDAIALVEEIRSIQEAMEKITDAGITTALVLLEEASFDREAFLREMRDTWQVEDEPYSKDIDDDDDDEEEEEEEVDMALLATKGLLLSVTLEAEAIPEDEANFFARRNYMWPEAADTVKRHRAYLLVSVMCVDEDTDLLDCGELLVKAVTACCCQKGVLGVYTNDAIYQPSFYTHFADMLKKDMLPIYNLVWFGLYRNKRGLFSGYTSGMRALGYDEMEVLEVDAPPMDIQDFLVDIASYVLEEDVVLEDGETIDFSARQKLPVTRSPGVAVEGESLKIGYPPLKKGNSSGKKRSGGHGSGSGKGKI